MLKNQGTVTEYHFWQVRRLKLFFPSANHIKKRYHTVDKNTKSLNFAPFLKYMQMKVFGLTNKFKRIRLIFTLSLHTCLLLFVTRIIHFDFLIHKHVLYDIKA
ncbi:hypothetical protein HanXRQr2_Chr16g0752211 [Helianthus annuus]|uniref:Uncharacterized protein n=1 Tax=Helianthus annuus TaxID=4232 RepID=A0A9K3H0I9_HELAN|nr:hypothetical protein HanXRQr2_Chr16g0752211 [Helianthus annuus]